MSISLRLTLHRGALEHLDKTRSILNLINQLLSSCVAKEQWVHYEKYYTGSPKSGKDYRLFVEKLDILRRKWEVQGIRWHFLTILQYLRNICKNYDENCVTLYEIPVLCCLCTACELSEYSYKDFTHNYCHQYKTSYSSNFTEWFSILCTKDTYSNKQKQNSTLCQQDLKGCRFR